MVGVTELNAMEAAAAAGAPTPAGQVPSQQLEGSDPSSDGPPQPDGGRKYRGLSWDKKFTGFRARIYYESKQRHIGRYTDELSAARAYDKAAVYLYGENAMTNFGLEACFADPTEVSPYILTAKRIMEKQARAQAQAQALASSMQQGEQQQLQQLQQQQQQQLMFQSAGSSLPGAQEAHVAMQQVGLQQHQLHTVAQQQQQQQQQQSGTYLVQGRGGGYSSASSNTSISSVVYMGPMGPPQDGAVMQAQPPQLQRLPLQPPLSQPQPRQQFRAGSGHAPMQGIQMQGMQSPLQTALPMSPSQQLNTLLQPPLQQYQYQQQPHMLMQQQQQQQQQLGIVQGYSVMSALQGPSSTQPLQDAAPGSTVLAAVAVGMQPGSVMQPHGMTASGTSAADAQHLLWQQQQQPTQYVLAPLQPQQVLLGVPPASLPACPLWSAAVRDLSQLSLHVPAQQQPAGMSAAPMEAQLSGNPAAPYAATAAPAGRQVLPMGWLRDRLN